MTVGCQLLSVGLIATAAAAAVACRPAAAEPPRAVQRLVDIAISRDSEIFEAFVPHRTTFADLLNAHHLLTHEASEILTSISEQFDVRRLRAGQPYRLDQFRDGRVREFEYEIDTDRRILVRRLTSLGPTFEVELAPIEKVIDRISVAGTISRETPSLVQAVDATGERIELALALADVFAGEVDFNNDLQPNDTFRLVVERTTRVDGTFAGYGPILAAEYIHAGRQLNAVRFTPPNGKAGYYDTYGRSLKRFFLKSPLKFEPRITSRFSRARQHPILNYTRAHNGVDYAAPSGAPVAAVASGVVTLAGWTSGGGRTVRIRHASGYESEYLHLSSIAAGLRAGVRVAQSELVGRVGASGLATGPHLHYGLRRNGVYVNPVNEHKNMPPGEPVAALHVALFSAERDRLWQMLLNDRSRLTN